MSSYPSFSRPVKEEEEEEERRKKKMRRRRMKVMEIQRENFIHNTLTLENFAYFSFNKII